MILADSELHGVLLLDTQTNQWVPAARFVEAQPVKIAQALRQAVQQLESTGNLTGPTTQDSGSGRWNIAIADQDNRLKTFYLSIAGVTQPPSFPRKAPDGNLISTSAPFKGATIRVTEGRSEGSLSARDEGNPSSYTLSSTVDGVDPKTHAEKDSL